MTHRIENLEARFQRVALHYSAPLGNAPLVRPTRAAPARALRRQVERPKEQEPETLATLYWWRS